MQLKRKLSLLLFTAVLLAAVSVLAPAQTGSQRVSVSGYPNDDPTIFYDYDGSNNLIYVCYARPTPINPSLSSLYVLSITKAASTLTNIADSSNTSTLTSASAHGLRPGNQITIAGVTTDTDLNGTYTVLAVPSTTTLTFTTANVTDATYTDATMTASASAPRITSAIWSVHAYFYNGGSNLTDAKWAGGNPAAYSYACSGRASLDYR